MNEQIASILEELEKRSLLEKSRKVDVSADDRMLAITKDTGELFNMILRLKSAKNMLEIGMSVGYSTIWCAEALQEHKGQIITIEQNPNKITRAKENFQKAGVTDMVTIKEGKALEVLSQLNKNKEYESFFDFVLIDADKENVIQYFDLVYPLVKKGGIIATDNMLYPEKYREEMKKFSDYLCSNPKLRTITSPIGNGEEITLKLE